MSMVQYQSSEIRGRGYLVKQRAFIKLYLLTMIERKKDYAFNYLDEMKTELHKFGYQPTHSEIYKALHELTLDGVLYRTKKIKGDPRKDFQEIVLYRFTEEGYEKAKLYKKQMKAELDRCVGLLQKAIRDNY